MSSIPPTDAVQSYYHQITLKFHSDFTLPNPLTVPYVEGIQFKALGPSRHSWLVGYRSSFCLLLEFEIPARHL